VTQQISQKGTPVEFFTSHRPFLGSTEDFFEGMCRFFATDGEKHARGDNGGLGISVDVDTFALVAFAFLSLEGVFRVSIFDDLIVNDCLALMDLSVVRFCESDDGNGQSEVSPLLFYDGEALVEK
jgi:hypothetical protein